MEENPRMAPESMEVLRQWMKLPMLRKAFIRRVLLAGGFFILGLAPTYHLFTIDGAVYLVPAATLLILGYSRGSLPLRKKSAEVEIIKPSPGRLGNGVTIDVEE